jgi:hypothetical protein
MTEDSYAYETPTQGAGDWNSTLNETFAAVGEDVRALAGRINDLESAAAEPAPPEAPSGDKRPSSAPESPRGAAAAKAPPAPADALDATEFGVAADGETDDRAAIQDAIDAAADDGGAVQLPAGTIRLSDGVVFYPRHSGVTLRGRGYDTHLRLDGGHTEPHRVIGLEDDSGAVSDVTVEHLRVDGNRAAQDVDDRYDGAGVQMEANDPPSGNGNVVRNVWAHDNHGSGVSPNKEGTLVESVSTWNNTGHGVGADNHDAEPVRIRDVLSWENGGYGLDASSGRIRAAYFTLVGNERGFKTSTSTVHTELRHGYVVGSEKNGFQMTGDVSDVLVLEDIVVRDSGSQGFRFAQDATVEAGRLVAVGNGRDGGNNVLADGEEGLELRIEELYTCSAASGAGFATWGGDVSGRVDTLVAGGNPDGATENVEDHSIAVGEVRSGECPVPDSARYATGDDG